MRIRPRSENRKRTLPALAALGLSCLLVGGGAALAQDPQAEIDQKQDRIADERDHKQVLTSEISDFTDQIDQLEGEISILQQREAAVIEDLRQTKLELKAARERLQKLRHRLEDSIEVLEERLVAIYKQAEPDSLTVILQADGFDDLVERYEYLKTIQDQDNEIVGRVRELRGEQASLVEQIEAAKARLEAKQRELQRTRAEVEARQADLESVRAERQGALDQVESTIQRLEGDVSDLQDQVQEDLSGSSVPAPAPGAPSSSGMIWPVNGPITSPFCEVRSWESCHPGIDIGVPAGTPILAAMSGTVSIAAPYGGYGNYTCIEHGGGLSTCYAHQSSFATSVGASVSQGDVIGYVGCTGLCFGDHLHFEVRVNGSVVDPLGYL